MKNHTSLMELVIIMSLMVGAIPLLALLMNLCRITEYSYLKDKSIKNTVFLDEGGYPIYGNNIALTEPMIAGLSYIQDDYCPALISCVCGCNDIKNCTCSPSCNTSTRHTMRVYYDTNGAKFNKESIQRYLSSPVVVSVGDNTNSLIVTDGWKTRRTRVTLDKWGVQSLYRTMDIGEERYLVWNATNKCWVIAYDTPHLAYKID